MTIYPELRGKTAIMTGGNTGIGEAVARGLGAQGANLAVIGSHHLAEAVRVAEEIHPAGDSALALAADLTLHGRVLRGEQGWFARVRAPPGEGSRSEWRDGKRHCAATTFSPRVRGLMKPEVEERMLAVTPIGRIAEVDDQVGAVLFLASDGASYITGATIDITGGKVML